MTTRAEARIDHSYTREAVCPHCGYEHSDTWEWEEGKHECHECEKPFEFTRHVEATYSTSKYVDPVVRRARELKRERAKLKPPNLSFRNGPPPIAPRVGKMGIYDTTLNVWDENVDDGMRGVLTHALAVLHAHRVTLERDPRCEEQYPSLADDNWRGARTELRVKLRLGGRHLEITGYQEVNVSNPNGGEYDFGKYARMPRAMQLAWTATLAALVRALALHGYGWEEPDGRPLALSVRDAMLGQRREESRTPLEAFNERWEANRFERDATGFMADKEWQHACWGSGKDGDGAFLCTGDTRYFYHYSSHRLMRGTFYPAPNGQCMVAAGGEYLWMQPTKLFDCDPARTRRRYVPGQVERVTRELTAALVRKDYARVATLGRVLEHLATTPRQGA